MPVLAPPKTPKQPKGDPSKPYDVCVSVIHDDRAGHSTPVQKTVRYSFVTEVEAQVFATAISKIGQE